MKKLLLLLLSVLLICSLVACDSSSQPPVVPSLDDNQTPPSSNGGTPPSNNPSADDGGEDKTPPAENAEKWLNVSTYNIWHCGDLTQTGNPIRPDNIVNFMDAYDIDIIGMNEVDVNCSRSAGFVRDEYYKDYGSNQPKYIAAKMTEKTGEQYYWAFGAGLDGYHSPAHSELGNGQYGNAIVSKYPIKSTRSIWIAAHEIDPNNPKTQVGPGSYERRVLLIAEIDVDGQLITVISTHFGLNADERALAIQRLQNELQYIETPLIFMGDLNCGYNSNEIKQLNLMLKPTSTSAKPGTFVSSGARIDYIFTSEDIVTKDLKVPQVLYSDHYPVTVKVMLPKPEN